MSSVSKREQLLTHTGIFVGTTFLRAVWKYISKTKKEKKNCIFSNLAIRLKGIESIETFKQIQA